MMVYRTLREANVARQEAWCAGGDPEPDLAFRGVELAGEVGEALNVIKKIERERRGWRGSRATLDDLAGELADVVICADLAALAAGIDLDAAVVRKFNATSEKVGLPQRLAVNDGPAGRPFSEDELVAVLGACVDPEGVPLRISFKGWVRENGLRFLARAVRSALSRTGGVKALSAELEGKLRSALRFAASRSVMSAADERAILSALEPAATGGIRHHPHCSILTGIQGHRCDYDCARDYPQVTPKGRQEAESSKAKRLAEKFAQLVRGPAEQAEPAAATKAANLGKFGHHPDPAIDFEIEVETLQARLIDATAGISKPGEAVELVAGVLDDIERAMTFRVGGDPSAVRAKQALRDLEADAKQAVQSAAPEGRQEAVATDYLRGQIGEILGLELDADENSKALSQAVERILALTCPAEQAEPAAAYTIDYLGCEYVSRDVESIKRVAARGDHGPTEVVYLYEHPAAVTEDTKLLDTLRSESWDLRCFDIPTGGDDSDIGWRVIGHWQAEPCERVVAEVYYDDPRAALKAAMEAGR